MNGSHRAATAFLLAIWTVLTHGQAFGQRRGQAAGSIPQPTLQSVYPSGVRAGQSVEVSLKGNDLEGVGRLWFDHPGLKAEAVKDGTFRIIASPGTPLGHHDIRALGTYGVSNPRTFVVGDRVEFNEAEPNDTLEKAGVVSMNSVVNGEIATAADVDCFSFLGKKGQRVLIDVEAERIESKLDATVRLLNSQGREIGENRDSQGVDPFLDVTLAESGKYVVKIHDVTYRGQSDWTYRLTITDGPHIDAAVPNLFRAGETKTLTLYGRNLGGDIVKESRVDGQPLEKKVVTITAPERNDLVANGPGPGLVTSTTATQSGFEYREHSASGSSNSIFLTVTYDPVLVEKEPNNDAEHSQEITLPCDLSGLFDKPGDLDIYRFKAKKGESWVFDIGAERIGSPADPVISLQKVVEKSDAEDIASSEDTADRTGQTRFNTATIDSTLRWTASEDGSYQVVVNDLYAPQRGDVRLSYRLNIRPERPDFHLVLLPESPNLPDALTLSSGGRALAYAVALREDGFTGAIRVEAAELPQGVRCEPVTIPAGQAMTPIVFEAEAGARPLVGTVRLVGRSRFGDRKEELAYVPGTTPLGPDLSRQALGATVIWPGAEPTAGQQQQVPPVVTRLTRGIVMKVVEALPLALEVSPKRQSVTPGSLITFDLSVSRHEPFTEAVTVTAVSTFPNMGNPPPTATIPKGRTTGSFAFRLPLTLASGVYEIVLQGAGQYPFSKDPKAKAKPNITLVMPSNPVTLVVRKPPLGLVLKPATANLKIGAKTEIEVIVNRRDGIKDPLELRLIAPASLKIKAEPVQVEPGKPTKLIITSALDSPSGPALGVAIQATVRVNGEPVDLNEPLTLTIAK